MKKQAMSQCNKIKTVQCPCKSRVFRDRMSLGVHYMSGKREYNLSSILYPFFLKKVENIYPKTIDKPLGKSYNALARSKKQPQDIVFKVPFDKKCNNILTSYRRSAI